MINNKFFFLSVLIFLFTTNYCPEVCAAKDEFVYEHQGEVYRYFVSKTGENYTFKFDRNPGDMSEKNKAVHHVLQSLYDDPTIEKNYSQHFGLSY